jgi:DNA-binding protein HU-beta
MVAYSTARGRGDQAAMRRFWQWSLPRRTTRFDPMQPGRRIPLRGGKIAVSRPRLCITLALLAIRANPASGNAKERTRIRMSKAFIAQVIQESAQLTGTAANRAAGDVVAAIVRELKKNGKFTLPSFGTFIVRKTKARKGLNPRTGEQIKVKAGKTVRFKASPSLKKVV